MESRIQIDIDDSTGQPFFYAKQSWAYADPRDKMFQRFFNGFNKVEDAPNEIILIAKNNGNTPAYGGEQSAYLNIAIRPAHEDLVLTSRFVHNNSEAFAIFLNKEGLSFKEVDHGVVIKSDIDLFQLGVKWAKYRELNEPKRQS